MKPKLLKNRLTDNMYSTYGQFLTTLRSSSNNKPINKLPSTPTEHTRSTKHRSINPINNNCHRKGNKLHPNSKLISINQNVFRSIYTSPNQQNDQDSFEVGHKLDSHHCTEHNHVNNKQCLEQKIQNKLINDETMSPSISRELEPKKSINTQLQSYMATNNQYLSSEQTELDKKGLKLVQIQKYIQQIDHKVKDHNVQLQNQKIIQRSNTSEQQFRQNMGSNPATFQKITAGYAASTVNNFRNQSKLIKNDNAIDQKLNVVVFDRNSAVNNTKNIKNIGNEAKSYGNVGIAEQKQKSQFSNKNAKSNIRQVNIDFGNINQFKSSNVLGSQTSIQQNEEGRKFSKIDTLANLVSNSKKIVRRKSTLKETQVVIYFKLAKSYEAIIELTQQNIRNVFSVMKNNERSKKFFGKALHQHKILKELFIGNDQQFNMKLSSEEYMDYLNDIKKNQFGQIENMEKFIQKKQLYNPNKQKMDALKKFNILMQQSIIDEERKRFKHQIQQNNHYEKKIQNKQKQMIHDVKNFYKHDQLLLVQKLKDLNAFFKNLRLMSEQKQQNLINIAQQIDKTEYRCGNLEYVDKILRHKFNLYQNYDFLFKQTNI